MMINASTIYKLERYRTFLGQVYKLCSSGIYSKPLNAAHDLLSELLEHRLRHMTNRQIEEAIAEDNEVFSYKIIYAEKDLVRKHYRDIAKEKCKAELVANGLSGTDSSLPADLCTNTRTDDDIQEVTSLLPCVFANHSTAEWASYLLQFGEEETKAHFHQSTRQFKQKLNRACKLAEQRQLTTIGLLESQEDKVMLSELETLNDWHDMLAQQQCSDADIAQWITSHEQYVNEVVNNSCIHKQGKLVHDFEHASKHDQYAFCNLLAERISYIEHKLISR